MNPQNGEIDLKRTRWGMRYEATPTPVPVCSKLRDGHAGTQNKLLTLVCHVGFPSQELFKIIINKPSRAQLPVCNFGQVI